ncbi:galactose-1-phosphate uridylyltransferase [Kitasatospora sp. NBC_01250]|uniref:galactose-1-phosphate uridylyltransferase n=1 Tax=unclassified Kitasatospora TaxID=2633591 RepID=UPI002E11B477|nr:MULTISPECIES: galactose-1-phosphate uridylyltransferase [unclassified Kitasatospora]WSJ68853.1 galactose-1-phosphate uridylyltransferase [Kitasatospora sp. NBC_01302]
MRKTTTKLADGRELIYYDRDESASRDVRDRRPLEAPVNLAEVRRDPVLGDWVTVAAHRQSRTYHPPADECPLCPSRDGRLSEIPAADYDVVVFENRFPSLAADAAAHVHAANAASTASGTNATSATGVPGGSQETWADRPLHLTRPGVGRCEVVCFTADHHASFADLDESKARLVLDAWTDRSAELGALPDVEQVFCFENRGAEIGVTLAHPHGQIYAFPFVTPRTAKMVAQADEHRARTGRNLFEDLLRAERADPVRVVLTGEHWTAFVPFAARWPYEVHLYPNRRVPGLTGLNEAERAEFPGLYLDLLRRFDRLFTDPASPRPAPGGATPPTPYIAAWHQAPRRGGAELALHLELFTIRRTVGRLKFLAGVESGMDAFVNDVSPEAAAQRLREVAI